MLYRKPHTASKLELTKNRQTSFYFYGVSCNDEHKLFRYNCWNRSCTVKRILQRRICKYFIFNYLLLKLVSEESRSNKNSDLEKNEG